MAVSSLAALSNDTSLALIFKQKADTIKVKLKEKLWDKTAGFYKVLPMAKDAVTCSARELLGYTPWFFNMTAPGDQKAWSYLMKNQFFRAPYGLTTVEQDDPGFRISYEGHECQWNGPSWPFATSVTLTGLANSLNREGESGISREDYFDLIRQYSASQRLQREDGKWVPWIDENLNPFTGDWIARTRLKTWDRGQWSAEKGGVERGKDYNHSTYCDLIISGLIGIRPQIGNELVINPLLPENCWDYFCLDRVLYHGHWLTILYDKSGGHYKKGKGFIIFVDGKKVAAYPKWQKLSIHLNKNHSA
jgi:hypothetical protein